MGRLQKKKGLKRCGNHLALAPDKEKINTKLWTMSELLQVRHDRDADHSGCLQGDKTISINKKKNSLGVL